MRITQQMAVVIIGSQPPTRWLTQLRELLPSSVDVVFRTSLDGQDIEQVWNVGALVIESSSFTSIEEVVALWHHRVPKWPIFVLASSPTWQDARAAFEAGASDYVSQSINIDAFGRAILDLLDGATLSTREDETGTSRQKPMIGKDTPCLAFL